MPASNTHGSMPARCVVGVAPDLRAEREKAVRLAFGERRIGEQRGRDRLQRQRHPHLLHHVGFGGEVVVGLHRAGAVHHVEAERADLRHVGGHDLVAALRHHRHVGAASSSASCRGRGSRCRAGAPPRAPARDAPSARLQVWCTVSTGAPDSSNWPPGSSEIAPPPVTSASPMMFSPSMIGSQPSRCCMPSSSARMPRGPP